MKLGLCLVSVVLCSSSTWCLRCEQPLDKSCMLLSCYTHRRFRLQADLASNSFAFVSLINTTTQTVKDMEDSKPFHDTIAQGHTQRIEVPLGRRDDLKQKDNESCNLLHQASWDGDETKVRHVLMEGVNIHTRTDDGWTALHLATWNGRSAVIRCLLQAGGNPNSPDDEGETALH